MIASVSVQYSVNSMFHRRITVIGNVASYEGLPYLGTVEETALFAGTDFCIAGNLIETR